MNLLKTLFVLVGVILLSCSTVNIRMPTPRKSDFVDPSVAGLVNEYKQLAEINGFKFKESVGVSLIKIEEPDVIGLCHFADDYRQIQLDGPFFAYADSNERIALVFHELTHCYCTRNHDFNGGKYPENKAEKDKEREYKVTHGGITPGYYPDGCPLSLMAPIIVESACVQIHYGDYIMEMFDRCVPY